MVTDISWVFRVSESKSKEGGDVSVRVEGYLSALRVSWTGHGVDVWEEIIEDVRELLIEEGVVEEPKSQVKMVRNP